MSVGVIRHLTTCLPLCSAGDSRLRRYYGTLRLLSRLRSVVVAFYRSTVMRTERDLLGKDEAMSRRLRPNPFTMPNALAFGYASANEQGWSIGNIYAIIKLAAYDVRFVALQTAQAPNLLFPDSLTLPSGAIQWLARDRRQI